MEEISKGQFQCKDVVSLSYQCKKSHCEWIYNHFICTLGFPVLVRLHLYIETGPRSEYQHYHYNFCPSWYVLTFLASHTNFANTTKTTRTPAFWGYPPLPNDYPYHWVILDPKSKEDKSQSYKFKKFAKISNFWILKQPLHATHLLKLLDKMCKYEMNPMSIVEDTERTRFCPQTHWSNPEEYG